MKQLTAKPTYNASLAIKCKTRMSNNTDIISLLK